jgi:hypothetical protein
MARLPASTVRNFTVPAASLVPSFHGSQREDAIIAEYLARDGWMREASAAAKEAFLPGVKAVNEGDGRGRGATGVDAFRADPDRSCGGDFLSMKAPEVRADGKYSTTVELIKAPRATVVAFVAAINKNHRARKSFPLVVVHTDGGTFAPVIAEWCIRDMGRMFASVDNREAWALWNGVPVKPVNDRPRGAGGSPASVWVTFLRRELLGYDAKGNPKVKYTPDADGTYATLTASFSQRSGAVFKSGTLRNFAADVDAATVIR